MKRNQFCMFGPVGAKIFLFIFYGSILLGMIK